MINNHFVHGSVMNDKPKSYIYFNNLIIGCHEKSNDSNETDLMDSGNIDYSDSKCTSNINYNSNNNCSYRKNDKNSCCSSLSLDKTDDTIAFNSTGSNVDDWKLMHSDFVDVPTASDTSIRCVVQPPPDMLATHVCVEVGLVKSLLTASDVKGKSELPPPTIVVCSVDVEPCRKIPQLMNEVADNSSSTVFEKLDDDHNEDMLDRITQDLDYLLNRKIVDSSTACISDSTVTVDQNFKKQQDVTNDVTHNVVLQKRTKL